MFLSGVLMANKYLDNVDAYLYIIFPQFMVSGHAIYTSHTPDGNATQHLPGK